MKEDRPSGCLLRRPDGSTLVAVDALQGTAWRATIGNALRSALVSTDGWQIKEQARTQDNEKDTQKN